MGQPLRVHLTWEDFDDLPDDGNRYEIIDGEIRVTPPPETVHQGVSSNVHFSIESWIRAGGGGMSFAAPVALQLAFDGIVQPDLLYVREDRIPVIVGDKIRGAPDLVVEISGKRALKRDSGEKLQLYARHRVREYWIVDLESRTVTFYELAGDAFQVLASGTGDTVLASKVLSGFALRVSDAFAGCEKLRRRK